MTPEKGQHVKCFMRNSTMALEGIVEDWSDAQVVLKSLEGESIMIVHRPLEDIMLTKVVLEEIPKEKTEPPLPEIKQKISNKLHEVLDGSDDVMLQDLNLRELRELVMQQDQKIIAQKKREHFGVPGAAKRSVQYSNPVPRSAYAPKSGQKPIKQMADEQEIKILRKHFKRK